VSTGARSWTVRLPAAAEVDGISPILANIERVLQGRQPVLLENPVVVPLALPAN